MKQAITALRIVLWGMELLEKLDNRLRAGLLVIDSAMHHVETDISKVKRLSPALTKQSLRGK
jgi:hypothetical protein